MNRPTEALARITAAGYATEATPHNCHGSAEQAGRDAFDEGFGVTDALWFENKFTRDGTPDSERLSEWLCGFWIACDDEQKQPTL